MVTSVARSTLTNTLPLFTRNVLRQNLIDTQSPARTASTWIFKGEPEDRNLDPPVIIIDEAEEPQEKINMYGTKRAPIKTTLLITIWARNLADRDNLSGQIVETLANIYSADSDGQTIASQQLVFESIKGMNRDGLISKFPKLMRIREIRCVVRYDGV